MPLTPVTTSTSVYAVAPVSQTGYNEIRALLVDILGTGSNGYGYQSIPTTALTNTNVISALQWSNFISNASLIYQHLNNSLPSFSDTPAANTTVKASFANQLISLLNTAESQRYNKPPAGQISSVTQASQWTVNAPTRLTWGALIEHEITLTWSSANNAAYFFNLGGVLSFALTYPSEPFNPGDLEWKSLIDDNAVNMAAFTYSRTDYLAGNKNQVWTDVLTGNTITLTVTKVSGQVIKMLLSLSNTSLTTDLAVTNTFKYEYSTGAITAPQPVVTVQKSLGDTTTPIFVPTRILAVTTPSAYSWQTGATSTAQTINITNNGNTMVTVTSITFTNASGITQVTDFTGLGGTTNFTLNASQTKSFTLAYTGSTIGGPYNSSFTVNSNNDSGPITVATVQNITAIPFAVTVIPSTVTATIEGIGTWQQEFLLDISPPEAALQYSASFVTTDSPPGSAGWTIVRNNSAAGPISGSSYKTGPIIAFSPVGTASTSYTPTATLQITFARTDTTGSDSDTVNVTLNWTNPLTTYNLGTWLSPLAADNSVIGMSYDVIENERYLTIGVGMGADGSPIVIQGGGANADVANLGIAADPDFKQGQPQYVASGGGWSSFLATYGVWPNTVAQLPLNYNVGTTPSYLINIPTSDTYLFQQSADNDQYVYLVPCDQYGIWNGTDLPIYLPNQLWNGGADTNWKQSYTGSIYLEAGYYLIRMDLKNYAGPAGGSFQITNSTGGVIWNTRYPVRSGAVYLYWHEVMRFRIPANGTPRTIYSFYKYVKNSYQVSGKTNWGSFFNGDLFKVEDDGVGNLNIQFFGTPYCLDPAITDHNSIRETLRHLPLSFYYYIPPDVTLGRLSNLDPGPVGDGTQTRFFTGFDRTGNVITVLSSIPSVAPYPPVCSSGGGGGGGGRGGGGTDAGGPVSEV